MRKWGLLFLALLASPAALLAVEGTLKPIKGSVSIQSSGKELWKEIQEPTNVTQGDRIRTGPDSKAFLTTPDDHRVAIGPGTFIAIQRLAQGQTKLYLKEGAVRSKVRKLQIHLGQYYKIQTPTAVCAVRGTDFSVIQQKAMLVRVFEGMVDLSALRAELARQVTRLETGQAIVMDRQGQLKERLMTAPGEGNVPPPSAAPESQEPKKPGDKDPGRDPRDGHWPPPPGSGGEIAVPDGPRGHEDGRRGSLGEMPNWWDHPEQMGDHSAFFDGMEGEDTRWGPPHSRNGEPSHGDYKPVTGADPDSAGQEGPYAEIPHDPSYGGFNPYGNGFNGVPPPSGGTADYGYPPPTTVPPTGSDNTGGTATTVGLDALLDTMRNQNLHDQANSILVADLFQRHAVATDPLTGQLRQYADAILSAGPDGIRFVNATMIPGVPDTLNYTTAFTRFNRSLPAAYWEATKTAFIAGSAFPEWHAVEYHSDVSNTVDHLNVDATGGHILLDASSRHVTRFYDISARINGTTLWSKNGSSIFYLGGALPSKTINFTGQADIEIKNAYLSGDYLSVRNIFSDDGGRIVSLADLPSSSTASDYLNSLNALTTIRSNLLHKGSLDLFGSAQARTLSGMFSYTNDDAVNILKGYSAPFAAPLGLIPS